VGIETNDYIINGNMYRMNYQEVWPVTEETSIFLPLTYVHVCTLATDDLEMFPFAVINKDHIISLQESNVKQKVGEELTIAGILINRL
jgi:hypothetical protein